MLRSSQIKLRLVTVSVTVLHEFSGIMSLKELTGLAINFIFKSFKHFFSHKVASSHFPPQKDQYIYASVMSLSLQKHFGSTRRHNCQKLVKIICGETSLERNCSTMEVSLGKLFLITLFYSGRCPNHFQLSIEVT